MKYRKQEYGLIGIAILVFIFTVGARLQNGPWVFGSYASFAQQGNIVEVMVTTMPLAAVAAVGIVSSVLSLVLFLELMRSLKVHAKVVLVAGALMVFSPLYLFSATLSPALLGMPLLLGACLAAVKEKRILLAMLALIIPLLGTATGIVFIVSLSALMIFTKKVYKVPFVLGCVSLGAVALFQLSLNPSFIFNPGVFTDLGDPSGFPFFILVLFAVGVYKSWLYKKRMYPVFLLAVGVIGLMLFIPFVGVYANVIVSGIAAYGVMRISNRRWKSKFIKHVTLMLIALGLVASWGIYVSNVIGAEPSSAHIQAYEFLETQSTGVVLAPVEYGSHVQYFANQEPMLKNTLYAQNGSAKRQEAESIWHAAEISDASPLLDANNVSYIIIDEAMRKGGVWTQREGLLYLFRNNETFKNIYRSQGVEVWEYLR